MRHNIPYKAERILREKRVYRDGAILELRAHAVPKSARTPEGYKYSMVYIDSHGNRVLAYDNAEGKGHHKHQSDKESPFDFESIEKLVERFLKEVEVLREIKS